MLPVSQPKKIPKMAHDDTVSFRGLVTGEKRGAGDNIRGLSSNTSPVHLASTYGAMAVAVAQVHDGSPSQASCTNWLGCGSSSNAAFLLNWQTVDRSPWWQKLLKSIYFASSLCRPPDITM
jgi:hypothetical protein